MPRVIILTNSTETARRLRSALAQDDFTCAIAADLDEFQARIAEQRPDLLLVALDSRADMPAIIELSRSSARRKRIPILALTSRAKLASASITPDIDDFIVEPPADAGELVLRAKRIMQKDQRSEPAEVLKYGDLTIDPARCEVTIKGKPVELTFREYELLLFLASHQGRVYTRDALLNKVWGYDFYGGDRTVDVHIRRLRGKLETASSQHYIETVRNIGYRFKAGL